MTTFKTAAAAVTTLTLSAFAHPTTAQTLRIYHIDVDQADATLIVSPSGQALLVDSGKNGHGSRIQTVMQIAGVTQIDHFVATHYHEDHYGGIDDLVNAGVIVVNAYDRGDKNTCCLSARKLASPTFRNYQTAVGDGADHLTRGETITLDPLMTVTAISSGGVVLGEEDPPQHAGDENDMSIGLLITLGPFRYWVGGDVETTTEDKISARDLVVDIDLYQANHHGADNGSSMDFLRDMMPTAIIISNGSRTDYRHPQQSTLNRMQSLSPAPAIFQVNQYLGTGDDGGNVPIQFIADPETNEQDGTILVTVDAAAGTYTIAYGPQSHTFPVKNRTGGNVVIESLLPDPDTEPDRLGETVTLRNNGSTGVSMVNWVLRDARGRVWTLAGLGTVGAGQSVTIRREAMPMSLNNGGDTIELVNPSSQVVDQFTYSSSQPGVTIQTGN